MVGGRPAAGRYGPGGGGHEHLHPGPALLWSRSTTSWSLTSSPPPGASASPRQAMSTRRRVTRCGTESSRWLPGRARPARTSPCPSCSTRRRCATSGSPTARSCAPRCGQRWSSTHTSWRASTRCSTCASRPARRRPATRLPRPAPPGDGRRRRPALGERVRAAVDAGTEAELRLLAEEAVAHHAGFERGRPQRALPRLPRAAGGRAGPPAARRSQASPGAGRRAVPCRRVRPGGGPAPAHHRGGARLAGGGGRSRPAGPHQPVRCRAGPRHCGQLEEVRRGAPWPAGWRPACGAAARACGRERWT